MSLFPAYAEEGQDRTDVVDIRMEYDVTEWSAASPAPSAEHALLASDPEDEPPPPAPPSDITLDRDFYIDCKFDPGNLRVSTLYYPGRPQYNALRPQHTLGPAKRSRRERRRYYQGASAALPPAELDLDAELAERTRTFHQMLSDTPADDFLWLQFIDFQERCRGSDAALSTARAAAEAAPQSERVRDELRRLQARTLPPHERLQLLRAELAAATVAEDKLGTWLQLLREAARAGGAELDAAAAAALHDTRAAPLAYPHILYIYGGYLRAAGLWERLTLLLELVCSMNFPPGSFPPPADADAEAAAERRLAAAEDKTLASGLPRATAWARVERARASAHWRAPRGGATDAADPQRAALPADVAELLQPCGRADAAALLLSVTLRLAKVPLLPAAQHVARAAQPWPEPLGDALGAQGGEALLALARAVRRLPPSAGCHAAPRVWRRVVAQLVEAPHYLSDEAGFLSWVSTLWDACCEWTSGSRRLAFLCWRLRWLHSLMLLLDPEDETDAAEARRIVRSARAALKRWAGAEPLPYAHFARLEHALRPADSAARRAALHALRAARDSPAPQRLYCARVLAELSDERAGARITAAAVLGLAPEDETEVPLVEALRRCEESCVELEARASSSDREELWDAMLPGAAEWASARARLAPPARLRDLLGAALAASARGPEGAALRYWEQSACALTAASERVHAGAQCARAFAPHFPHNAYLALAAAGAPLWGAVGAGGTGRGGSAADTLRALRAAERSHVAALARVLPPLLAAEAGSWEPADAARVVRACERAGRSGAGGALLCAVRLEAEARAERPRAHAALFAALDDHPQHKWLYVRGAAWCPAEAGALCDVLLERALRVHALIDELEPLNTDVAVQ